MGTLGVKCYYYPDPSVLWPKLIIIYGHNMNQREYIFIWAH